MDVLDREKKVLSLIRSCVPIYHSEGPEIESSLHHLLFSVMKHAGFWKLQGLESWERRLCCNQISNADVKGRLWPKTKFECVQKGSCLHKRSMNSQQTKVTKAFKLYRFLQSCGSFFLFNGAAPEFSWWWRITYFISFWTADKDLHFEADPDWIRRFILMRIGYDVFFIADPDFTQLFFSFSLNEN